MRGSCRILAAALLGLLCSACSVTRHIPEGQYFLQKVKIEDDRSTPRKERITASDMEKYVRQTPNKRFLGTNFYVWLYEQADPAKDNRWNNWKRKIGQAPVTLDMGLTQKSAENLKVYMDSKGFFSSQATYEVDTVSRRKRATVTFRTRQGEPYRIDSVSYEFQDNFLEQIVLPDTVNTLLHTGDIYDVSVLDAERERIAAYLKERGYYNFSVNNISYAARMFEKERLIDLRLIVKQYLTGYDERGLPVMDNNMVYRIDRINIFPDYDPTVARTDTTLLSRLDTVYYRGLNIIYEKRPNLRPPVLRQAVPLYPNYVYNSSQVNRAYSDLMALGYFKSAKIAFEEQDDIDADYIVDEKAKTATLTPHGQKRAEAYFKVENLSDPANTTLQHHINQAIKARGVMQRDVDYVVRDGQVIIVDEFTGRLMFGRRYSEGLHQAIEAKEHVTVARESKTLATITFQNYFRLYKKLSGMTGTALTEEEEFGTIYNLDIIEIPTNRPIARIDDPDVVYKTEAAKYRAVIAQVKECHAKGQPVLVGTVSIEKNEHLSYLLSREGIKHNLLNAKNHEKEAEIVAQAGKLGAVTVATNMAGRGTDIMLGGNAEYMAKNDLRKAGLSDELIAEATGYAETDDQEILDARALFAEALARHKAEIAGEADRVREAGGLFIIGTERHDSRRIDNQLRGRAGRQGDPGETRFYLSLEDDLLRLFGGERITNLMDRMNLDEDTPIENKMLSKSIENAQTSVESRNFQSRKATLEYDDVMNKQREIIYGQRKQVLDGMDIKQTVLNMLRSSIESQVAFAFGEHDKTDDEHRADALKSCEGTYFPRGAVDANSLSGLSADDLTDRFYEAAEKYYEAKEAAVTSPIMRELERVVLLRVVDEYWMDHIDAMSELRQAIRLQSYGNNKPIDVYKQESLTMFEDMISAIQGDTVRRIFSARVKTEGEVKRERVADGIVASTSGDGTVKKQPRKVQKIGRNDPCPCGSGKKYKQCCGR